MHKRRAPIIFLIFALALAACNNIKEGTIVTSSNKEGACLTQPYGPCNTWLNGSSPVQSCYLSPGEVGTIIDTYSSDLTGNIVEVNGQNCSGWTAENNVKNVKEVK